MPGFAHLMNVFYSENGAIFMQASRAGICQETFEIRTFYGRYEDLIKHYEVSLPKMLHVILLHAHKQ